MIVIKISTFILILLGVFCLGVLFSPIMLIIDLVKRKKVSKMVVSDLLKNFNQYNAGVDTVEIVTNDYDFGGLVTIDILSIDNLMNEPEFVDMRIATVRRWWLKRIFTADIHPSPYNMQIQIIIEI